MLSKMLIGLLQVLACIPWTFRRRLGYFMGQLAAKVPTKDTAIAELQLQQVLNSKPLPTVAEVYGELGQTFFETLNLKPVLKDPQRYVRVVNEQLIDEILNSGRPTVALTAHTGNWDFLGAYMVRQGLDLWTIGREARRNTFQPLLEWLRSRYEINTIWRNKSAAKKIISILKRGGTVAALIDQHLDVRSQYVPFFKLPTRTSTSLIELGKRFEAHIVTAFCHREPNGTFLITLASIDPLLPTQEVLAQYHQQLEHLVRQFPEQWVWMHKRWRSHPDGSKMSHAEYREFLASKVPQGLAEQRS